MNVPLKGVPDDREIVVVDVLRNENESMYMRIKNFYNKKEVDMRSYSKNRLNT